VNKVVVLDRDGTIVIDRHYLADPDGLEFEPGATAGLQRMAKMGYRLVIVTNQSGIARGMLSVATLSLIHERLREMLAAHGVHLDGIYFCPHAPGDACECRKPNQQLMVQAAADLGFDQSKAVVIGDKDSDVEFGQRAGARTMLIGNSSGRSATAVTPDYFIANLTDAAEILSRLDT